MRTDFNMQSQEFVFCSWMDEESDTIIKLIIMSFKELFFHSSIYQAVEINNFQCEKKDLSSSDKILIG